MPNEMKTTFDGFRAGLQDNLDTRLTTIAENMATTLHTNLTAAFMSKGDTPHMIWLTIADISVANVRAYQKIQGCKENE